jgi:CRP-like cAMP-binding protein
MMISPEVLRRFHLFAGVDDELLKIIAMAGETKTLASGEWLFHEGEEANCFYLILNGKIDLMIAVGAATPDHAEIDTLITGDFVGWSALLESRTYTLGAAAATDTTLVCLDATMLHDLLQSHPEAGYRLMHRLSQGISDRLVNLRIRFVSLTEA